MECTRSQRAAICTLFEGDFHFGVGALVNSLYAHGFRGIVWAGYRGALPPWAVPARKENGYHVFIAADGCEIRFVLVAVDRHLTHYKPAFMLDVWSRCSSNAESLFYFDPDIVVAFPWEFFEEWTHDAVALCEDVNASVGTGHPKRRAWRRYFGRLGIDLPHMISAYANAGFVGVSKRTISFLNNWDEILQAIATHGIIQTDLTFSGDYRFWFPDQDALNIALMRETTEISMAGRDAMAFEHGTHYMFHAVGGPKPWRKRFITEAMKGRSPSKADKAYWRTVETPIRLYSHQMVSARLFAISIGAGLGRLFGRH